MVGRLGRRTHGVMHKAAPCNDLLCHNAVVCVQLSWWSMGGLKKYEEVMKLFDRGYNHASRLQSSGRLNMFHTNR